MNLRQHWARLFSSSPMRRRPARSLFGSGQVVEVLESRRLLAATVANLTLTNSTGDLTLTSTDIYDAGVTITRSGNNVVFTAAAGTQITLGTSVKATQTISLATVKSLTVNLGTGISDVAIVGLSTTGNININGATSGDATVSINAGTTNTTVGGSIVANLSGASSTFNLYGSTNFGGNMTVTGSVSVTQASTGDKQVNLAGPLANNPSGGKLSIGGNLTVFDTGTGFSGLHIDDGVTITGNVSFDNSANTVSANKVEIFSNSLAYGVTTIGGTVNLKLSSAVYDGNAVTLQGFGTPLTFTGAVTVASGAGADDIALANTLFKGTLALNSGSNPSFERDIIKIDGSTFNLGVTVTTTGRLAELDLGTDATYAPTTFKGTFSAFMTGANSQIYISNSISTSTQVGFASNVTFVGGNPAGTYYVQGPWSLTPSKFVRTNFSTTPPVAVKANIKATLVGTALTLTSTDVLNPTFTVTRSGTRVVITAGPNTQITYGTNVATSQSILLTSVSNLTINLGTGISDVTVSGLAMTGNLTVNGAATGDATVSINAIPGNTTIGGSIIENLGGSAGTLNIYGSTNNGGTLTVNGSVTVTESGAGKKQVNLAGPLAGNPAGGLLIIKGSVSVTDTGHGESGLHIDDGVTITGNVAFDNSANLVNSNVVGIYSNSIVYGTTSIGGTVNVKTSRAMYAGDSVTLQGFGNPLTVTSGVVLNTGAGADDLTIANTLFSTTTSIDVGTSPSFERDLTAIDGATFTGAFTLAASGASSQLNIGSDSSYLPTYFKNTFAAYMTGPSSLIFISNPLSTVAQVVFASTATVSGGTPNGTMTVRGLWSINQTNLKRTNFDLLFV